MSLQENGDYSVEVGITSLGGEYNDVGTSITLARGKPRTGLAKE